MTPELVIIDVRPGAAMESQSGIQAMRPRIFGAFMRPAGARTAAIVIHPTSNFMAHYLLEPLAARNIAALGLNTRYVGNDSVLIMERAIQDLGAGVKWLRSQGFEKILLIGNSGGGALTAFYQAQAENLTIADTPAGDPIDLTPQDLPPANGIVLAAAHLGRSRLLDAWLDPAVVDERDPMTTDRALDMFNPDNGPAYAPEFIAKYRASQRQRNQRIEAWARARLHACRSLREPVLDEAFIIYRTLADLRCLDPSIDANDRQPGTTVWGPPRAQNYGVNSMGRYTSLTGYLSQWSQSSRADGPTNLAKTSIQALLLEYTADASTFPSDYAVWMDAAPGRIEKQKIQGGNHYLAGQPRLVGEVADRIEAFGSRL